MSCSGQATRPVGVAAVIIETTIAGAAGVVVIVVGVAVVQGKIMFRRVSIDGGRKFGCIHSFSSADRPWLLPEIPVVKLSQPYCAINSNSNQSSSTPPEILPEDGVGGGNTIH